jgi:hypothetical protein
LEDFPKTEGQARYFLRNCSNPHSVFYVRCSLDESQQRLILIGKDSPSYIPSSILSKKIKLFNDHAKTLLPFLKQNTKFVEIDTAS